jgi:chromosome segregation ATPase
VEIDYEYNPLWTAFRPTLWVWSIALVGCAIFVVSTRPKAPVTVALPSGVARLRPENLKTFVDSYEEKMRILSEIDALEARVQKGRIPRRRYKVQKKTLEMRLATLSRDLGELKESMRASGGHYADLMRQLEVAETEINDAEANIKNIEARQNRGEVTMELVRNRMEEYGRRKEKAETTINGILLRLREETR